MVLRWAIAVAKEAYLIPHLLSSKQATDTVVAHSNLYKARNYRKIECL